MKHYSDIKDSVLYSDPLVGDITLDNILNFIEICVEETKIFEMLFQIFYLKILETK